MGKQGKNNALILYQVLMKYSDKEHPLSMSDIKDYMAEETAECGRDSIARYLNQLEEEMGIDIHRGKGQAARYYIDRRLLDKEDISSENVIVLQEQKGFDAMIRAIMEMADKKLAILNKRKRETLPLSDLCIGMQCGGSDAFSGVSANPSAGYAADMLVNAGATVMFSEVTEVRDGVHYIAQRCVNKEVCDKLAAEMKWYDHYLEEGQVDRSANPTPGNKKGGLCNIVEKAMGSIAKSGTSPIVEVLSPAERPTKKGLIYAATPASDIVCGPSQLASGITLQVFMTGRGTPYGLAAAPVIKVCSRNEMKEMWQDLIDVNAGPAATGEADISQVGTELFNKIIAVASGKEQSFAEKYQLHNDLCIFNPAPIT